MYRFIKDGNQLALIERPRFIKIQPNGYFGLCEEKDAQGVIINDIAYSIEDRLEDRLSVSYEKVNVGELIMALEALTDNFTTIQNQMDEITVDHEYRLVLLELGVAEEV